MLILKTTLLAAALLIIFITFFITFDNFRIPIKELLLCFLWGGILSGFVNYVFIYATRFLYASSVTFFMLFEYLSKIYNHINIY